MNKILFLVLALLFTEVNYADNKHFDTMVTFGDSLSDNGNLYNYFWHALPASPPYYLGQFSNGILWAEQLYNSYFPEGYTEGFQNYAVGGAGAVLSYKQYLPYTLTMELNNYLYWHSYGRKDTTLYTIWIGGNNYLNGPLNIEPLTDGVVNAIGKTVESLIAGGGNKFFIPNLPDLGRTPWAKEYGTQILLNELVQTHNAKLAAKVDELKLNYPEANIVYFDIYSFFNQALEHAEEYSFSKIDEPCYLGGYIGWLAKPSDQQLQAYIAKLNSHFKSDTWESIRSNPELKEAVSASYSFALLPPENQENALACDEHVFWDRIHPTTKAHTMIATKARQLLDEAGLEAVVPVE